MAPCRKGYKKSLPLQGGAFLLSKISDLDSPLSTGLPHEKTMSSTSRLRTPKGCGSPEKQHPGLPPATQARGRDCVG